MQPLLVQKIIGILLILFSTIMLVPVAVGLWYGEHNLQNFLFAFGITFGTGTLLWLPAHRAGTDLRLRDGFLVVVLFWTVLSIFGALPFYLCESCSPRMTVYDALFESFSGLTTTGATVLVGLDNLPHSFLIYRHLLQWLGGLGIIILAVAILPMLSIGGMQLYRAEMLGPVKDTKLTPRITETAKMLWYIYVLLTSVCAVAYWVVGMTPFDAICHSFSTIAIGGFSTHDDNIGYFDNVAVEMVAVVFMLVAGVNFGLHFSALRYRSLGAYVRDSEFKLFIAIMLFAVCVTSFYLTVERNTPFGTAMQQALFQAVSIGTTTGFTTPGYVYWPGFLPTFLIAVSFIGCCAGSTGGGIKVIRFLLLIKQGMRELLHLTHPHAVVSITVGNRHVTPAVVNAVWGFFAVYVGIFAIMFMFLLASGLDEVTAFSAVAATLNNLGPGLASVSESYAGIGNLDKLLLCVSMLLGRLEVLTLLVVFTPWFWHK